MRGKIVVELSNRARTVATSAARPSKTAAALRKRAARRRRMSGVRMPAKRVKNSVKRRESVANNCAAPRKIAATVEMPGGTARKGVMRGKSGVSAARRRKITSGASMHFKSAMRDRTDSNAATRVRSGLNGAS